MRVLVQYYCSELSYLTEGIDVVGSCVQSFTEDIHMYINSIHLNLLKVHVGI